MGRIAQYIVKNFIHFKKELIWLREEYIHTVVADTI